MSTAFTQLVGCELPIQQAPAGSPASVPELPIAVAAAGAHGMLAAVLVPADVLAERIDAVLAHTRAFGVNFLSPLAGPAELEVAAERAPLVEHYLGRPDADVVARARAGGALVSWQVVSGEEARAAEAAGCDFVVARGIEAGGRAPGGIGLLPLLDEVLEAVAVPVVAAGGIATSRAVAAVLAAGASAARAGTRFLLAEEAATHPVYADALLRATAQDTVLTDAFSAPPAPRTPHRVLRGALDAARALTGRQDGFPAPNPTLADTDHVEAMALYAGEGVGAVRRREPAAAIVADLASRVPVAP